MPDTTYDIQIAHFCEMGEGYEEFLYFAAQPLLFSTDLLYKLWLNFRAYKHKTPQKQASYIVVSDLILSGICKVIGADLFCIEEEKRKKLSALLAPPIRKKVAFFIEQYALQNKSQIGENVYNIHTLWAKSVYDAQEMERIIIEKIKQESNAYQKANYLSLYFKTLSTDSKGLEKANISLEFTEDVNDPDILKYVPKELEERIRNWESINRKTLLSSLNNDTFSESQIPEYLTFIPPIDLRDVIGREKDLKRLEKAILAADISYKIVLISGMGGIGKTTLAQVYVEKNKDKYLHIAWLTQNDNNPESIFLNNMGLLSSLQLNFQDSKLSAKDQLKTVFAAMRQIVKPEKNNLLVIDNATSELQTLREIPMPPHWKVLVTSRHEIKGCEQLRLSYLSETDAYQLFLLHYNKPVTQKDIATVQNILSVLSYHTLSIELYAKTAQHLQIPLFRLEQKLQNSLQLGYETAIQSPHKQGRTIEQVFSYLIEIFQLGELSEKEEKLLRLWTLLPSIFIPVERILSLWQLDVEKDDVEWFGYINAAKKLRQKGWLSVEEQEDGSKMYAMNKILQQVLLQKWNIKDYEAEYRPYLDSLTRLLNGAKGDLALQTYLIPFGESALKCLKEDNTIDLVNALANSYNKNNRLNDAFVTYEKGLGIYRRLSMENPQIFLPNVANTLNNLGAIHERKSEFNIALKVFQEALNIYRRLSNKNPQEFLSDLAKTLNNLGTVYYIKNELDQAIIYYNEALEIYRRLAGGNPQVFLPNVPTILNNLATLYGNKQEFSKALLYYEEALEIYRRLGEENLQVFLPNAATILNNLASLYNSRQEFSKALVYYEEALDIYRRLAGGNPQVYSLNLANTLNDLGAIYKTKSEFNAALKAYEEALGIYKQLSKSNSQNNDYQKNMSEIYSNLGFINSELQNHKEAIKYIDKSLYLNPDNSSLRKNKDELVDNLENLTKKEVKNDSGSPKENNKKYEFDVFLSFANEDAEFAKKINNSLKQLGLKVWCSLDKLRRKKSSLLWGIQEGIRKSEFAVIIVSEPYLTNKWNVAEAATFFALEKTDQPKIIPIGYRITYEEILKIFPLFFIDRFEYVDASNLNINQMARKVLKQINYVRYQPQSSSNFREVFNTIWYSPKQFGIFANRNPFIGLLLLDYEGLYYKGQRKELFQEKNKELFIKATSIQTIEHTRMAGDVANNWVKVSYDNGQTAWFQDHSVYFVDSHPLSNLLGGSNNLYAVLQLLYGKSN
ncbi:MAG: tetratricopeptide repeat protein [Chitinophagales bacterium]